MKRKIKITDSPVHFEADTKDNLNREYHFSLDFFVFIERGVYIAYCPALDISTSGEDFNDVVKNFYECFQLHIECCIENKTLLKDLEAHGWKVSRAA